jgi:hypothetical protein
MGKSGTGRDGATGDSHWSNIVCKGYAAMSVPINAVTVTPGQSKQVSLQNGNLIQAVKISNKAPYDLTVDGLENTGARWQAAGLEEWYFPNGTCNGTCELTAYNNANLSNPGAGIVLITPYYMNDTLPKNAGQSTTIPTQVVQANVSTIQILQNDGFPGGSQFLEVTPAGAPSSTWSFDNVGNFFIKQYIAGVLSTLIQGIAGSANPIQFLGNLVNWDTSGNYNGQNLNLGKRKILSIQNGAGTPGNVFGVDANDNTFIQHNSNNQTIIYDKNGSQLVTIDATGNTIYNNTKAIEWKDNAGTARNVLSVDVANNTILRAITGNDQILFQNAAGSIQMIMDLVNGLLNIPGKTQSVTGDTSGTMSVTELILGGYKITIVVQNNYKQAGAAQTITLVNGFVGRFFCSNWGCGGLVLAQNGTTQNANLVATVSATGGTFSSQASLQQVTFGWCNTNVNQIKSQGGYASPHDGIGFFIGP